MMASRVLGRNLKPTHWMASFGVVLGVAASLAPAPAALADPSAPNALVVRAVDLDSLAFGDAIGVIAASSAETGIATLLGDASDIADVTPFEDLEDARAALDLGTVDSLYLTRSEAEVISADAALALFEIPAPGAPEEPEADLVAFNDAPVDGTGG